MIDKFKEKPISSADYITGLDFYCFETYSLLRGKEYELELARTYKEHERLSARQRKGRSLDDQEVIQLDSLSRIINEKKYLLGQNGNFHPTAIRTAVIDQGDPIADRLVEILQIPAVDVVSWMCAPVYRDAVVFRDREQKILSVLNVCLSCEHLTVNHGDHVVADIKAFPELALFFEVIGHEIEK